MDVRCNHVVTAIADCSKTADKKSSGLKREGGFDIEVAVEVKAANGSDVRPPSSSCECSDGETAAPRHVTGKSSNSSSNSNSSSSSSSGGSRTSTSTAARASHLLRLCCRYALVTVPIGVLKRGDISFRPPLPRRKAAAIRDICAGPLMKVFLRFETRFWGSVRSMTFARMAAPEIWTNAGSVKKGSKEKRNEGEGSSSSSSTCHCDDDDDVASLTCFLPAKWRAMMMETAGDPGAAGAGRPRG